MDAPADRLDSWKEIASYLDRSERTVRRWEEKEGLPVHRLQHDKRGSIYAFRGELDRWRTSRSIAPPVEQPHVESAISAKPKRFWWAPAVALFVVVVVVSGAYWMLARTPTKRADYVPKPEAYRAFQKARFGLNAGRAQIQSGIRFYQEAVTLDPGYAEAWAGLATAHLALTWFGDVPARESMEQARKEARKSAELDQTISGPWRVLAHVSHYLDWDYPAAERQYQKGLALNPRDAVLLVWYAEFLLGMGRTNEALTLAKRAQEISPRWLGPLAVAGNILSYSGRHDLAVAEYGRAMEIEPRYGLGNHFLGRAYLIDGQWTKAIDQLRLSNELLGQVPFSMADFGYALAAGGRRDEAKHMLSTMLEKQRAGYYPAFAIAEIQLGLGHTEAALDWLDRAADERHMGYYPPSCDPLYKKVATHPRFLALLDRMHMQPIDNR